MKNQRLVEGREEVKEKGGEIVLKPTVPPSYCRVFCSWAELGKEGRFKSDERLLLFLEFVIMINGCVSVVTSCFPFLR